MSDLIEAIEQYDEGIAGTHQVDALAIAARKWAVLEETYDTGQGERKWWCSNDRRVTKEQGRYCYDPAWQFEHHDGCGWVLVIPERANPERTP